MDPKPYKFVKFGDIHGPKLHKFTRFGDIHDPKPEFRTRLINYWLPSYWHDVLQIVGLADLSVLLIRACKWAYTWVISKAGYRSA